MKCRKCNSDAVLNGKSKGGVQRYRCKECGVQFQQWYKNKAYLETINEQLISLVKESCGIRSISRILGISSTTVLNRILKISDKIRQPPILCGRAYEVDEMMTYIGNKNCRICIVYALDRKTKSVVAYCVGRRNKMTLNNVVYSLLLSNAKEIRTDRFPYYSSLIPKEIHHVKQRGINFIERNNLTIRTHLKRLNRRTLAYSKSILILSSILRIYFWHNDF